MPLLRLLFPSLFLVLIATSALCPVPSAIGTFPLPTIPSSTIDLGANPDQVAEPLSGPQRTLVILVEFSDVKHKQDRKAIDGMIFGQMADYFAEVSYGRIHVVGESIGWYTLPNQMRYYGADIDPSRPGSDAHTVQLIGDAIDAAQGAVNFDAYPRILIIHAGVGQEDAPDETDLIWSEALGYGFSLAASDGTVIHSVALAPEMEESDHSPLGVYAHEYGHLLSLPDLYEANSDSTKPDRFMGRWSLMGTGLWLGNPRGSSPAELEAWSRIKLGWLIADSVELPPTNFSLRLVALRPLETASGIRAIMIPIASSGYYLIEFRSKIGFDSYLPQTGVLITRIDETRRSGEGVVRVIDADPSTETLNDAAYDIGGVFIDPNHHVFIDILSGDGNTFSVLVGNQELSGAVITTTRIVGPDVVNATYSQPITPSTRLVDQSGRGLAGQPIRLQYYRDGEWKDFEVALTDSEGKASFNKPLTLIPGVYYIRFSFAGGRSGQTHLVGNDHLVTLNLRKISTNLQLHLPQTVEATTKNQVTVVVLDEFGKPAQNLQVLVWVDDQLIRNETISDGILGLDMSFGLHQLGKHTLKIQVEGNNFYDAASESKTVIVLAPTMTYLLLGIVVITIAFISWGWAMRRRRSSVVSK